MRAYTSRWRWWLPAGYLVYVATAYLVVGLLDDFGEAASDNPVFGFLLYSILAMFVPLSPLLEALGLMQGGGWIRTPTLPGVLLCLVVYTLLFHTVGRFIDRRH